MSKSAAIEVVADEIALRFDRAMRAHMGGEEVTDADLRQAIREIVIEVLTDTESIAREAGAGSEFAVPNLDALDVASLGAFVKNARLALMYAHHKVEAALAREAGKPEGAREHEQACEAIYGLLPLNMRW